MLVDPYIVDEPPNGDEDATKKTDKELYEDPQPQASPATTTPQTRLRNKT